MKDESHLLNAFIFPKEPNNSPNSDLACFFNRVSISTRADGWKRYDLDPIIKCDFETVLICFCKHLTFFINTAMPHRTNGMYDFFRFKIPTGRDNSLSCR